MLTQKQESFCQHMLTAPSAAEAYRRAYNPNVKPESAHRLAHTLMENVKVQSRLAELRAVAVRRTVIDAAWVVDKAAWTFEKAAESGQYAVCARIVELGARMNAMLTDKIQVDRGEAVRELERLREQMGIQATPEQIARAADAYVRSQSASR